jgi:hypothetical protein
MQSQRHTKGRQSFMNGLPFALLKVNSDRNQDFSQQPTECESAKKSLLAKRKR